MANEYYYDNTWGVRPVAGSGYTVSQLKGRLMNSPTDSSKLNPDIKTKYFDVINQGKLKEQEEYTKKMGKIGGTAEKWAKTAMAGYPGQLSWERPLTATGAVDWQQMFKGMTPAQIGEYKQAERLYTPGTVENQWLQDMWSGKLPFDTSTDALNKYIESNINQPAMKNYAENLQPALEDAFIKSGGLSGSRYGLESGNLLADIGTSTGAEADKARWDWQQYVSNAKMQTQQYPATLLPSVTAMAKAGGEIPQVIGQAGLDKEYAAWAQKFPLSAELLGVALSATGMAYETGAKTLEDAFARSSWTWQTEENLKAADKQASGDLWKTILGTLGTAATIAMPYIAPVKAATAGVAGLGGAAVAANTINPATGLTEVPKQSMNAIPSTLVSNVTPGSGSIMRNQYTNPYAKYDWTF